MLVDEDGTMCTKCGEVRPESDFYHHADGRRKNPCRVCCRARARERYESLPIEQRRERAARSWDKWYSKNNKDLNEQRRRRYVANHGRRYRHKLTLEDVEAMLVAQSHRCAVCSIHENDAPRGVLFIDHDHTTGQLRALLCDGCNRGLGCFRENPDTLRQAADYIEVHRGR